MQFTANNPHDHRVTVGKTQCPPNVRRDLEASAAHQFAALRVHRGAQYSQNKSV
jgi:hypothetical protein